ncbi:tyrosine-protein phosphatase non-receptor type 22 [Trichomycterus rosablanca]|uniref:tyrosine-protein phosphatase non-receptor type 22 n=1 Tax=Trichomycterus rosablanca TaxID=2290929 RepID=UPI002F35AD23
MDHHSQLLRSLLAQLASKQFMADDENGTIAAEFLKLKRQSTKYRTEKTYATKAADKQENVKKNRYKDIVPFDHSRVKLSLNTSKNDTDYINANFIQGALGPKAYIATQGPLPHTVLDFWRMLWEYNVEVIIMACREFEMGKKKCERYWPETMVDSFVCEPFTILCELEENKGDYLIRTLKVTFNKSSRTLKQLHYMNWPDHGVPDSIPPILEMLQDMRLYQDHEDVPICIHCSAGCGRTGALCAIDYTWNLLKKQMITDNFSIFDLVKNMRTQRPSIVQTKEQYELVYKTIHFLFERHLQVTESYSLHKEVHVAPPALPAPTDNTLSDLSSFKPELEPALDSRLYSDYDFRHPEMDITTEHHNNFAPEFSQPLHYLSSHSQPAHPGPKFTPTNVFNEMKNWAIGKSKSKPSTTPMTWQQVAIESHKPQISEPTLLQQTEFGHQKSQIPDLSPPRQTEFGYQQPHIQEAIQPQQTNLGYHKHHIHEPTPSQQTDIEYQTPQMREYSPTQQQTDLGYQTPQIRDYFITQQQTHLVYQTPQLKEPSPTQQQTHLGYQTPQMRELSPTQHQRDLGHQTPQMREPSPTQQQTDLGYQAHQMQEPTPAQEADFGYDKPAIPEFTPHCHTDLKHPRSQITVTAMRQQTQPSDSLSFSDPIRSTPVNELIQNDSETLLQPLVTTSLCQMVEDPYFGSEFQESNKSLNTSTENIQQWNENPCFNLNSTLETKNVTLEIPKQETITDVTFSSSENSPPPLPERTPDSYILADAKAKDISSVSKSVTLDIPPSAASETVNGGCSPSPPPLPERTPESFILADEDLLRIAVQEMPHQTVLRVGRSSEWSGNSNADVELNRSWSRTKSLRTRFSVCDPVHIQSFTPTQEPLDKSTPFTPFPERIPDSSLNDAVTPPVPERTPESFIMVTDKEKQGVVDDQLLIPKHAVEEISVTCLPDTVQQRQRLGTSSEWAGSSQTKTFLDVMSRSKSVKVKHTKQDRLCVAPQPLQPSAATAESVSPAARNQPSANSLHPTVNQSEKTSVVSKARAKSFKFLKGRQKSKTAPPPAVPPPPYGATAGGFKFDFGLRFGKPKGPRSQPETWV